MIDHLVGHTSVNTDIFSCDKTCFIGAEIQDHMGYIKGISHASGGMLCCIGTSIFTKAGIDPSGGNRIDPHPACKAACKRMS